MARLSNEYTSEMLFVGDTSSRLIRADKVFQEVNNLYPTEEGGYRSILGMFPYVRGDVTNQIAPANNTTTPSPSANIEYGKVWGIHHARLQRTQREILLLHVKNQIWELHPWDRDWHVLIGPSGSSPQLTWQAPRPDINNRWPTQFVTTPIGVVIIPTDGRAYFYDGTTVAPFGFAETPGAPVGRGPSSSKDHHDPQNPATADQEMTQNDQGYAHNRLAGTPTAMDDTLGYGRIGTVETLPNVGTADSISGVTGATALHADAEDQMAARLLEGKVRYRMSWVDNWGNESPLSNESADVTWDRQYSKYLFWPSGNKAYRWISSKCVRLQLAVFGLGKGPAHVIGKNLYRSKDILNTGDTETYLMSNDAEPALNAFATITDRDTQFFPDNVPDAWLSVPAPRIVPTPVFRVGALAFGRFWAANLEGNNGGLRFSRIGQYGTFEQGSLIIPDPTGAEITGLHTVDQGLLAFTETSTFLIVPNDSGDGFRVMTLSSMVGCMGPSSIATMRDGAAVWLGRDGFYGFSGGEVSFLFGEHRDIARRMNRSRMSASPAVFNPASGQYECWVAYGSSADPNRRFKFDGQSWHWDDYDDATTMRATCVTQDPRSMVLGAGVYDSLEGVWCHDHGHDTQTAKLVSGWLQGINLESKATVRSVRLWLRETANSNVSVKVRRNWRAEVKSTVAITMYPDIATNVAPQGFHNAPTDIEANPDFWDVDIETSIARRRRPFWAYRTVDIPACESFQLEVTATGPVEVLGISYVYTPRDVGGASSRR